MGRLPINAAALAFCVLGALASDARGQRSWWNFEATEDAGTSSTVKGVQLPFYIERNPRSVTDDLQGVTRMIYANQPWYPRVGGDWFSGGHVDGGNIYRESYTRGFHLVGPSGFTAVSSLAMVLRQWGGWWWGGYRGGWSMDLYGAASRDSGPTDRLIRINWTTGRGTQIGTFGTHNGLEIQDIEGIAAQVFPGWWGSPPRVVLWGVTGFGFDGTPGDLFTIDQLTGRATYYGSIVDSAGNPPQNEVTGITFDFNNKMFASIGDGPNTLAKGTIIQIDLNTRRFFYWGISKLYQPKTDLFFVYGQ